MRASKDMMVWLPDIQLAMDNEHLDCASPQKAKTSEFVADDQSAVHFATVRTPRNSIDSSAVNVTMLR
jgi:hypothetical protein